MKCLVTGATGFIGRPLSQQLADAGHELSLTSRSGGEVVAGVNTVAADLLDPANARRLCQGVDTVFHLAGIADQHASPDDYRRVNVEATTVLAEAALAAGVTTFLFVSSSRAENPSVDESDEYGRSKLAAEDALSALLAGTTTRLLIVRPSLVYGANVKGNLALLARAVRAGLPMPPDGGQRSMIGVSDLSRLLRQLAEGAEPSLPVLTVSDGESYSTRRIVAALRAADGRSGTGVPLPGWCWKTGAALLDLLRAAPVGTHFSKLFGDDICTNNVAEACQVWSPEQLFEDVAGDIMQSVAGSAA